MTKPINLSPLSKQNQQKKIDKASLKGSKVVFANTYESKALLELTIEADRLFRALRGEGDIEKSAKLMKKGRSVICGLSDFISTVSKETGHGFVEPAIITELKRMMK